MKDIIIIITYFFFNLNANDQIKRSDAMEIVLDKKKFNYLHILHGNLYVIYFQLHTQCVLYTNYNKNKYNWRTKYLIINFLNV